jgi:hypothetical protein
LARLFEVSAFDSPQCFGAIHHLADGVIIQGRDRKELCYCFPPITVIYGSRRHVRFRGVDQALWMTGMGAKQKRRAET